MNLNQKAAKKIEFLLKELDIEYTKLHKRITLPCPVHKGDNPEGCSIYYGADFPYWRCFTHHCHNNWKGLTGLFAGIMDVSYGEAKVWLENRVGKGEKVNFDVLSFIMDNRQYKTKENSPIMSREDFLGKTIRPSKYFVERGFSEAILNKYDVGNWSFTGENVIPVYDIDHKNVFGYIERSSHKKCCLCDSYHNFSKPCPITTEEKKETRKWKNSYGFNSDGWFYNIWFSHEEIRRTKTAILVEGQGDVWRLSECNIKNHLGMFGSELKPGQRKILDELGVQNIILFLDPDEAGIEAAQKIESMYGRYYNFFRMTSKYDPGDSSIDYISSQFNNLKGRLCLQ